ncbi:MAG: hypothetical protein HY747_04905 [Elusimicrobia bacterium]|nr:hypothetical protein [Elusimicrobiota bacterium]
MKTLFFVFSCLLAVYQPAKAASEERNFNSFKTNISSSTPVSSAEILNSYLLITNSSPQIFTDFNAVQRHALFLAVYYNAVARLDSLSRYDPQGIIGFCFGRAMAAHLLGRIMGLKPDSIKKLFAIGDLRKEGEPAWRFHVTTIVRGTDAHWHAIDPIMGRGMEINEWISAVHSVWDKNNKAKFYITHDSAVLPDVRFVPEISQEQGQGIIELSFNPEIKPGFKIPGAEFNLSQETANNVYELDSVAGARMYFLGTEDEGSVQFDFVSININNETFSYNNYFKDLIETLLQPQPSIITRPYSLESGPLPWPAGPASGNLGSLRFDLLNTLEP